MAEHHRIRFNEDGDVGSVFYDGMADFIEALSDDVMINRASHVEPDDDGKWWADLAPVGGTKHGPFNTRGKALTFEVKELEKHGY